ncbi:MAG: DUF2939 domain-containing protein [Proteobacteria bacterium]|nr:DUF2939 domain-containing protein [Pseudomonadota bacterium]
MNKRTLILTSIVLIVIVGWIYFLPYRTLGKIREAALNGDSETLKDYIDFSAFRESVKENVNELMASQMATMSKEEQDNPFMVLGMMLAGTFADKFVDSFVTPSAIVALTKGQKPSLDEPPHMGTETANSKPLEASDNSVDAPRIKMRYDTLSRFSVTFIDKKTNKSPLVLILRRQGLSWMLTSLQMNFDQIT